MLTSAFTCTGPYAVLIMLGIKRVENRSMSPNPVKGRCAVGCSKSFCKEEYGNFVQWAARALPPEDFKLIPAWSDVEDWPGRIVGVCDYVTRMRETPPTPQTILWDDGYAYWWDLSEVVCFDEPIPCRGNVGMWQMSQTLSRRVTEVYDLARSMGAKIASAEDAVRLFRAVLPVAGVREGFFVLPLDCEKHVLASPMLVSLGHETSTTSIDTGAIFREVLQVGAEGIIVAHNHPSGDLTPSKADIVATAKLRKAGEILGVPLIDHLILDGNQEMSKNTSLGFVSLMENYGGIP